MGESYDKDLTWACWVSRAPIEAQNISRIGLLVSLGLLVVLEHLVTTELLVIQELLVTLELLVIQQQ